MTKLYSEILQVINTQHGLRPLVQRLLCAPASSARRVKGYLVRRGPDYEANSKLAIQIVSTSFLGVKLENKQ